uniref:Uncharacterized protein n=1 Tax=Glossina palpalis gambiensis TaxID=67801 RepID=A0A1B0C368_9MUSC
MHSICSSIAYNVDTLKMIPKAFDFNKSVKPEKNRQINAINKAAAHFNYFSRLCCAVNNFSYASTCAHSVVLSPPSEVLSSSSSSSSSNSSGNSSSNPCCIQFEQ